MVAYIVFRYIFSRDDQCKVMYEVAPKKFVFLDKQLLCADALVNGTVDGRHPYVRKWVFVSAGERHDLRALMGNSGAVEAEMTALGVNLTIAENLPLFIEDNDSILEAVGDGESLGLVLVQRSGIFPLALVFGMGTTSKVLKMEEVLPMLEKVSFVAIADLNH